MPERRGGKFGGPPRRVEEKSYGISFAQGDASKPNISMAQVLVFETKRVEKVYT